MIYRKGTLLIPTGPVRHLHIVMNDPVFSPEHNDERVLVVNISSVIEGRFYDSTCVLQAGCHPFVLHPSYVYYKEAVVSSVPLISQRMEMGEISAEQCIDEDLYGLVRAGFDVSRFVTPNIKRFIKLRCI